MFSFATDAVVYLHREPVDFRKQINGLALIVQDEMTLDPMQSALFVFTNRAANRVKILWWDRNGFCLWTKRLEKDRFVWPFRHAGDVLELGVPATAWHQCPWPFPCTSRRYVRWRRSRPC